MKRLDQLTTEDLLIEHAAMMGERDEEPYFSDNPTPEEILEAMDEYERQSDRSESEAERKSGKDGDSAREPHDGNSVRVIAKQGCRIWRSSKPNQSELRKNQSANE